MPYPAPVRNPRHHPTPAAVRAAACPVDEFPDLLRAALTDLVDEVPGAVSASLATVTPARPRSRPWLDVGTGAAELDRLQAATGQGPTLLAAADGEPVVSGDVWADPRWDLTPGPDGSPVRSVVAVALPGPDRLRVVVSVLGRDDDLVDPDAVERTLTALPGLTAAVSVVQARQQVADLQVALGTNRAIGASIGITMATRRLTYDDAARLLRLVSNHTNTRLADLAEQVLHDGVVPEPPG